MPVFFGPGCGFRFGGDSCFAGFRGGVVFASKSGMSRTSARFLRRMCGFPATTPGSGEAGEIQFPGLLAVLGPAGFDWQIFSGQVAISFWLGFVFCGLSGRSCFRAEERDVPDLSPFSPSNVRIFRNYSRKRRGRRDSVFGAVCVFFVRRDSLLVFSGQVAVSVSVGICASRAFGKDRFCLRAAASAARFPGIGCGRNETGIRSETESPLQCRRYFVRDLFRELFGLRFQRTVV